MPGRRAAVISALPLLAVGFSFLILQPILRPKWTELFKNLLLAATFLLWGAVQLMTRNVASKTLGDVVIALYVTDLTWTILARVRVMGEQLIKSIERRGTPASGNLELDPAFCWQAVYSRDQRFDGRFFAGISTTGVYCRSICPVSFGAPHNVRWFQSAAAAEAAGFRACKRCRPDTSPGSSAWFGTWAVVSHALKLISQGALNQGNLEQLAERVGIGSRHLRRLFHRHLGASPLAIARSHRVQVARSLIVETDLPVRQIASCTGFASIRQFNHSVKTTFGRLSQQASPAAQSFAARRPPSGNRRSSPLSRALRLALLDSVSRLETDSRRGSGGRRMLSPHDRDRRRYWRNRSVG